MSARIALAAGTGLVLAMSAPARAQVISHRDVGSHMATAIVAAAVAKCEQNGGGLTVAVRVWIAPGPAAGAPGGRIPWPAPIMSSSPSARPIRR